MVIWIEFNSSSACDQYGSNFAVINESPRKNGLLFHKPSLGKVLYNAPWTYLYGNRQSTVCCLCWKILQEDLDYLFPLYHMCTLLREETQIGFLHLGSRFHSTNCLINFRQSVRYGLTISILNEPIFARKKFLYILSISIKKRCSKEITRFWMHQYSIKCAYKLLSLQHSVKVVGKKVFFIIQHNETFSSQNFSLCTYCIHQSKSQSCLMRSFTEKFCLIFNSCISKEEVNNKQKCYWTAAAVPSK